MSVVIIDINKKKVIGEFHSFMKPDSKFTEFSRELTGITSKMCNSSSPTLKQALKMLHEKLFSLGLFKHEFVMLSSGSFEGHHL